MLPRPPTSTLFPYTTLFRSLDFTAIGPAVNLAARLEKLAGRLGRTILASEDFVDHCGQDRKSTRLNSSHSSISYAVFCLKKKKKEHGLMRGAPPRPDAADVA